LLYPKPDDLISPDRFFVREAEMYMWDEKKKKKKKRFFFLFNDILLLCRRETHKRYWLRINITLRSPYVSVEDIENASFNNEFRLHCRSRSFILYAMTGEQKKDWIADLRHSIAGSHPEEKKNDGKLETEQKDEVRKTKKETKVSVEDIEDPEPEPEPAKKKDSSRNKSRKTPKKISTKEEVLPFDPFAPVGGTPQRHSAVMNPMIFQGQPAGVNPFMPNMGMNQQPNLIVTAPLSGGYAGFNQNMGQPGMNYNPGFNAPNNNPFAPNTGFNNQGANFNANMGFNQPNINQPSNPYVGGGFNAPNSNPFAANSGFNQQVGNNPFVASPQNGIPNPFLNNQPFQKQNPLF